MHKPQSREKQFRAMARIAKLLGLAVVVPDPALDPIVDEYGLVRSELVPGQGYDLDALCLETVLWTRHRIGLVRAGQTGTSSPFGDAALITTKFLELCRTVETTIMSVRAEAVHQQERIRALHVQAPIGTKTNITAEDGRVFDWVTQLAQVKSIQTEHGEHEIALLSMFVDGAPTVAVVEVVRHGTTVDLIPRYIQPTTAMVLTDHDGRAALPLSGQGKN